MTTIPFKRHLVGRGDLLVLAHDRTRRLMFKGCGLDGSVIATWLVKPDGRPQDAILLQRQVLVLRSEC